MSVKEIKLIDIINKIFWKHIARFKVFLILFILLNNLSAQQPAWITGKVTDGVNPIQDATVRFQGSNKSVKTNTEGYFKLSTGSKPISTVITAWKKGCYNGSVNYDGKSSNLEIVLMPLPEKDNPFYSWIDPAPNPNDAIRNCADCHKSPHYEQWMASGHAQSATNPLFLDMYNGSDTRGNIDRQPGYKLDYPHSSGNCSNCHAPLAAVKNYVGVNINNLNEIEKSGVSCDFCHKVKTINLKENTSANTGVMMMELLRPSEKDQVFFGPYDDSPHPYTFSKDMSKSEFCAPCHQGSFWDVPMYESYSEWHNSSYAKKGIQCQDCHMPSNPGNKNIVQGMDGVKRVTESIHSHSILGSGNKEFLINSVSMKTEVQRSGNNIKVNVEIKNTGAGHHLPTGQPMRNLILLIQAVDNKGNYIEHTNKDNVIPFWGGRGNISDGNYEGLPGKGFAKVLWELYTPYRPLILGVKDQHVFPAPHWRNVMIKEDNRIPALMNDISTYDFKISSKDLPVKITSKLIYRKTFKNWANMKGWIFEDTLLSENVKTVR